MNTESYKEYFYSSNDGLRLFARDYPCLSDAQGTVLCMHGLTRNSADFEPIVSVLQRRFRVIVADQRGRGRSAYDPEPQNYHPGTYVNDMFCLLDSLEVNKAVLFGTSMGGLMATMMYAVQPKRFSAVIINDICPDIAPKGLARIMGYVGSSLSFESWEAAVSELQRLNKTVFPNLSESEWDAFAKRIFVRTDEGGFRFDYDPNIQVPLKANEANAAPPDLWPLFQQAGDVPLMLIHGELSDLLEDSAVEKFKQLVPSLVYLKVAGVGHAPLLNEPEVALAVMSFLDAVVV